MTSIVFQIRFRIKDDKVTTRGFRIIPIRISSRTDYNDFTPTEITKETTIISLLNVLKENGKNLEYVVREYPLEWK